MAKVGNRVKETSATTGTGTLDLAGAPTGFRGFGDEFTSGDSVYYLLVDDPDNPTEYEYGTGTFTSGTPDTLSRDSVEGSSNGGSKVSWIAGCTVVATPTAAGLNAVLSGDQSRYGLAASVAGNALTISLTDANGDDPSASGQVSFDFRYATSVTGTPTQLTVSAAASLVLSSGSTLGTSNGTAFRLWIVGFNDGGTFRLGAINCASSVAGSIFGLEDDVLSSATAEGGSGGADSPQTIYAGAAVTSKAMRILGYMEWSSGLAAAGIWSSAPTKIQIFGPGVRLPSSIVKTSFGATGAVATGTTVLPWDDTVPQSTEGDQYMTGTHTPQAAMNWLFVEALLHLSNSAANQQLTAAIFQDANTSASAVGAVGQGTATAGVEVHPLYVIQGTGATSQITFKIRAGAGNAGTTTFNGDSTTRRMGGLLFSWIKITEIMA